MNTDTSTTPTSAPEQSLGDLPDTIQRLRAHQDRLGLKPSSFCRRKLGFSLATWSRILSGNYPLSQGTEIAGKLVSALAVLDGDVEYGRPDADTLRIVDTAPLQAVRNAVKAASAEPRNRLVALLMPTGGGKTWALKALVDTYPERCFVAEGTESWRGSYFAALRDIGLAAGVPDVNLSGVKRAEEALVAHLKRERPIVCIDEAHYLGARTLNLVKLILNATPCVVVMAAIPVLWEQMKRGNTEEADQLRNRTYALVSAPRVIPADVAALLRSRLPGIERMEAWREVVQRVTDAANRFGRLNAVDRIAQEIRHQAPDGRYERDDVATALDAVAALSQ